MGFLHLKFRAPALFAVAISLAAELAVGAPVGNPSAPVVANAPPAAVAATSPLPVATNIPPQPGITGPPAVGGTATRPADAPRVAAPPAGQFVADDYRIGPQDLLEVQIYGVDGLKRDARVNWRGVISLPLIGMVEVAGLTGEEAEALIAARYEKDFLRDPQVSLFIKEFTSQRITIEGAVNHPGIFPMKGQTSLLQAIAMAGGQGQLSEMTEVMLYRTESGLKKTLTYDVVKIRAGEMPDPQLVSDDVVVVKRTPSRVAIRDSLLGDIINVFNPFNYLPRY